MTDSESTPAPDDHPLHRPPEILKPGHLLPSEWDHRFDRNNQPLPPLPPGSVKSLGGDVPDPGSIS